MEAQRAGRRRAIETALLEFRAAPQRHVVALRQPPQLFDAMKDVLLIAGERSVDEESPPPAAAVVQAARFFVRSALLQPRANHYALLGLQPDADAGAIKDRYRLLMRLLHPDFAASAGSSWPGDAATRLNQAYEVLSAPDRRAQYDAGITGPREAPRAAPVARDIAKSAPAKAQRTEGRRDSRQLLRGLATAFGSAGALALVGTWVAGSGGDRDMLVQRATTRIVASHDSVSPLVLLNTAAPTEAAPLLVARDDEAAAARPTPAILAASAQSAPPQGTAPAVVAAVSQGTAPAPAPMPEPVAAPPLVAHAAAPVPSPAPGAIAQKTSAAPAISDVQPLLMHLLQQIESGWGDNVIDELPERSARRSSGAQALAKQIDSMLDGARPVKVARSEFHGEPRDGRLVVTGQVVLEVRDTSTPTRRLALVAEFGERDGAPVLTRLAPATP